MKIQLQKWVGQRCQNSSPFYSSVIFIVEQCVKWQQMFDDVQVTLSALINVYSIGAVCEQMFVPLTSVMPQLFSLSILSLLCWRCSRIVFLSSSTSTPTSSSSSVSFKRWKLQWIHVEELQLGESECIYPPISTLLVASYNFDTYSYSEN